MAVSRAYVADAMERVGATMVMAGIGGAVPYLAHVSAWWGTVVISGLSILKVALARFVGDPESAAALPADRGSAAP